MDDIQGNKNLYAANLALGRFVWVTMSAEDVALAYEFPHLFLGRCKDDSNFHEDVKTTTQKEAKPKQRTSSNVTESNHEPMTVDDDYVNHDQEVE
nr:ethylene-responsive transcription factor RAP2-13-like [Ipomoea batatas]